MARRKARKRPVSPGVTLGRDLKQPELSAGQYQGGGRNYLDPHVAKREIEAELPLKRFFANQAAVESWSQPVPPVNPVRMNATEN